jgi:hypothetical protein
MVLPPASERAFSDYRIPPARRGLGALHFKLRLVSEMGALRNDLHEMIERFPDAELAAARRYLEFLSQEPVGPEFAASIRRGMRQAEAGQTVVCQTYDEMVDKIRGKE